MEEYITIAVRILKNDITGRKYGPLKFGLIWIVPIFGPLYLIFGIHIELSVVAILNQLVWLYRNLELEKDIHIFRSLNGI